MCAFLKKKIEKKNSRNLTNLERFEILESTKLKYNDIGKRGDVLS